MNYSKQIVIDWNDLWMCLIFFLRILVGRCHPNWECLDLLLLIHIKCIILASAARDHNSKIRFDIVDADAESDAAERDWINWIWVLR